MPGEPRMIYIASIPRPKNSAKKDTFSLVSKYNVKLEKIVSQQEGCYLMFIKSVIELSHFDAWGRLTPTGKSQFWREFDDQIAQYDRWKIELFPTTLQQKSEHRTHRHQD